MEDPQFAGRLLGLTVIGGLLDQRTMPIAWQRAIEERGPAAWPDYNTMCDPAGRPDCRSLRQSITWITLDVTLRAPLRATAPRLLLPDHPLGASLGRMIDAWQAFWFPTALPLPDDPSPVPADAVAILHDPLAVASLFPGEFLRLRSTKLAYGIEEGVFACTSVLAARRGGSRLR